MRTMYDSITATDIPLSAQMVAGYVDGIYRWSDSDWQRFAGKPRVRIAVFASTNDGHVLDVESGAASPAEAPDWASRRRAAGQDPSVYMSDSLWPQVRAAFQAANLPQPHYWVANWDGLAEIPGGAVAKQYANPALSGGHFDLSAVADFWPGVDLFPTVPAQAPTTPLVNAGADSMLISFYNGQQHLFEVDPQGAIQHFWQQQGGYPPPGPSWAHETLPRAGDLAPGGLVSGDQFYGQQHVYAVLKTGKVLHVWQSLVGSPNYDWSAEELPT